MRIILNRAMSADPNLRMILNITYLAGMRIILAVLVATDSQLQQNENHSHGLLGMRIILTAARE
jgi:hypothetical protein